MRHKNRSTDWITIGVGAATQQRHPIVGVNVIRDGVITSQDDKLQTNSSLQKLVTAGMRLRTCGVASVEIGETDDSQTHPCESRQLELVQGAAVAAENNSTTRNNIFL